jgi:hypothetical protein
MPLQGNLSIEQMCRLTGVSRAGFYRSLQERLPVEEDMEVRSAIQQIAVDPCCDLPASQTVYSRH